MTTLREDQERLNAALHNLGNAILQAFEPLARRLIRAIGGDPVDARPDSAIKGAAIAIITLREQIDQNPDWGRDEILDHFREVIRTTPLPDADLERITNICQDATR